MKKLFLIFSLIGAFALSGCGKPSGQVQGPVVAHDVVPPIPVVQRPQLEQLSNDELTAFNALPPTLQAKLIRNDKALMSYADQMQVSIQRYNDYANGHNGNSAAWLQSLGK